MFWRKKNTPTGPLTDDEKRKAATVGVFLVNLHGDSPNGWPGHLVRTVDVCLTWEKARDSALQLSKHSEMDDLRIAGPHHLIPLYEHGIISLENTRALLASIRQGATYKRLPAPLLEDEKKLVEAIQIYYIWYEDKFHYGGDRDSFAVMICLSKEEAEAEMNKRRPVETGSDGYSIVGPCSLSGEIHRPGVVREVLGRIKKGRRGPVPIPSEMW